MCRFPHSDICGLSLICSSPQLFAACHVLHRLPVPRHSPCALFHLTFSSLTDGGFPPFRPVELYETFLKSSFQSPLRQNCNLTLLNFALPFSILSFLSIIQFSRCAPIKKTDRAPPPAPANGKVVGLDGLEPSTSRLSGVRSNRLSYKPIWWR